MSDTCFATDDKFSYVLLESTVCHCAHLKFRKRLDVPSSYLIHQIKSQLLHPIKHRPKCGKIPNRGYRVNLVYDVVVLVQTTH